MDDELNIRYDGYGVYKKFHSAATQRRRRGVVISSGSVGLDALLGEGLPRGCVVEMFGPPASGKSTLALLAAAETQRKGGIAVLIDSEAAYDARYAATLGVDIAAMPVIKPYTAENARDAITTLLTDDAADLIIVDSAAALASGDELNAPLLAAEPGDDNNLYTDSHAAMMRQWMSHIKQVTRHSTATIILINQTRIRFARDYERAHRIVTDGGSAVSDLADIRIATESDGSDISITVLSNDKAPFRGTTSLPLPENRQLTHAVDLANLALQYAEVQTDTDGGLYYRDRLIADDRDGLVDALTADVALYNDLRVNVITTIIKDMIIRTDDGNYAIRRFNI